MDATAPGQEHRQTKPTEGSINSSHVDTNTNQRDMHSRKTGDSWASVVKQQGNKQTSECNIKMEEEEEEEGETNEKQIKRGQLSSTDSKDTEVPLCSAIPLADEDPRGLKAVQGSEVIEENSMLESLYATIRDKGKKQEQRNDDSSDETSWTEGTDEEEESFRTDLYHHTKGCEGTHPGVWQSDKRRRGCEHASMENGLMGRLRGGCCWGGERWEVGRDRELRTVEQVLMKMHQEERTTSREEEEEEEDEGRGGGGGQMSVTQQLVVALSNQMNESLNDITRQLEYVTTLLLVLDTRVKNVEERQDYLAAKLLQLLKRESES